MCASKVSYTHTEDCFAAEQADDLFVILDGGHV